ncbi:MAG TPA: Holliday junction resolvase RuvX [Candidatus Didemnitutus sp.]|nr:Holliday junction resolvase RuvX [Candidatus Didemnitutus sp.]
MTREELLSLNGKRLCAIDFGMRRIGVAVCDEMHIVVSTRPVVDNTLGVMDRLVQQFALDRTEVVLVGVPRHHDDRTTPIIETIERFVTELRLHTSLPVFEVDEAFSTKEARSIMVATGVKKKKRQTKGVKDQMAAAVILRDAIQEVRSITPQNL